MLPFESENIHAVRRDCRDEFENSERLIHVAVNLQESLVQEDADETPQQAKLATFALLMEALRRYRSIALLCEVGHFQDADILTRSLFETALAVRFVVKRPKRLNSCSAQLKANRRKLPPIPRRFKAADFRAALYLAWEPVNHRRLMEKLIQRPGSKRLLTKAQRKSFTDAVDVAEANVGSDWIKAMKRGRSYSGLSIIDLAENYRMDDYYAAFYGPQSHRAHGAAALSHLNLNGEEEPVSARWQVDPGKIAQQSGIATALFLSLLGDIDKFFNLRQTSDLRSVGQRMHKLAEGK